MCTTENSSGSFIQPGRRNVISPDTPEPLAEALRDMEAKVDDAVSSLMFAAPELVNFHKSVLKQGLGDTMSELWEQATSRAPEDHGEQGPKPDQSSPPAASG